MPLLAVSTGVWVGAGVVALVVLALLSWAGWLKIFGPVLFYEVVRSARRGRYFLLRSLYAAGLFFTLLWVWALRAAEFNSGQAKPQDLTVLAETFFWMYITVQFFAVLLLTPGYVA